MKAIKIQGKRPKTAFQRLSSDSQEESYKSVSTAYVAINQNNARNTFKTLHELDVFMETIDWPKDGLEKAPFEFIDGIDGQKAELEHFRDIVELALSIKDSGQLQPVTVVNEDGRYRTVSGSTRVMACHLLGIGVEIKVINPKDEIEEYKAHLSENLNRKNLSFTETAKGYKTLFEMLINKGTIKDVSRKNIMKEIGVSRAYASMWNKVLNAAITDEVFCNQLLSDEFTSLKAAYTHLRNQEELSSSIPRPSSPSKTENPLVAPENIEQSKIEEENGTETQDTGSEVEQPDNFQLEHWSEESIRPQEMHLIEIKCKNSEFLQRMVCSVFEGEAKYLEQMGRQDDSKKLQGLLARIMPIADAKSAQVAIDELHTFIESL